MIAEVEQPDRSYKNVEMGVPPCGTFCDHCGDCIGCSQHDDECYDGSGWARWVIYLFDEKNPHFEK